MASALTILVQDQAMAFRLVRRNRQGLGQPPPSVQRLHLGAEMLRPFRAHTADRDALPGQPLVRVVGAQREAIFGARGEHTVRLGDAARDQIVDHDAEVALGAVEHDFGRVPCPRGGVETRHKPLRRSLFVARGAVDLTGQEQAAHALGFQRGDQLARVHVVVFDRVAGPDHAGLFQPRNGRDQRALHLFG
jgi:hypothetical protein